MDTENITGNQSDMKNTLEEIDSRADEAEDQVGSFKDKVAENTI